MVDPKISSRPRRLLVAFAALVVLAAAWSGFWYFAASKAEAVISAWIEQESRAGRVYACASRTIGGYPFRIELRCSDPVMELTSLQPPRVVKAKDLVALAQVYEPNLIIAEITGPLSVAEPGNPAALRADWRLAQASLRGCRQAARATFDRARGRAAGAGRQRCRRAARQRQPGRAAHPPQLDRGWRSRPDRLRRPGRRRGGFRRSTGRPADRRGNLGDSPRPCRHQAHVDGGTPEGMADGGRPNSN